MRKGIIKKISALQLLFVLFCLVSCLSCISKDGKAAEEPPPVEEAADEEAPRIQQQEMPPPEDEAAEEEAVEEPQEEPAEEEPEVAEPEPEVSEPEPEPATEEIAEEEPEPPAEEPAIEDEDNEIVAVVDDVAITMHEHLQTKSEVEDVVEELNKITQQKDYRQWLTYLDSEYRQTLSDRAYLTQISNSLPKALRDRRIRLNNIRDYFEYVFVPSRQNVRVDDIRYITPTRVYVIMNMKGGRRAAVYILEKEGDGKWMLVNKN